MLRKFNLALIPLDTNIDEFVTYARENFSIAASNYLLGSHSAPHVTICHFETEASKLDEIVAKVKALQTAPITLTFKTQRSKEYPEHSLWGQWSWVSLIPDKLEELQALHLKIAAIVTPTNAAFDAYDPHLTLFNSKDHAACGLVNQAPNVNPALSCEFRIQLGRLDDVGQITEILNDCCAS